MTTESENGESVRTASGPNGSRPSFRLPAPLIALGIVAALLVAGTAAALAVPIVSVTPDRSIAQMLPAGTALYVSADLNPSGATRQNLDRIARAFTDQPGWTNISRQLSSSAHGQGQQKQCVDHTQSEIQNHLSDLGHTSAWAILDGKNLDLTGPAAFSHLSRNMVFLASLDVHRTLVQALGGFHLSLQQKTSSYRGTTIYKEVFSSCGKTAGSVPNTIYAALVHGYVVLGLQQAPIERVIDTAAGRVTNLSANGSYTALMAQLPSDRLGGYYLSGSALKQLGLTGALSSLPNGAHVSPAAAQSVLHPTAGALRVQLDGFRFVAASEAPSRGAAVSAAGRLANQLPSDTLFLLSIQGLRSTVDRGMAELRKDHLLTGSALAGTTTALRDVTANLSGEVDLALLRPASTMGLSGSSVTNVPLSLFWQVKDGAGARQGLQDLARRGNVANALLPGTASDGTPFEATQQGYGYAVRKGWAIASLDIRHTVNALSPTQTLASNPAFARAAYGTAKNSSLWYADLRGLRVELEKSILPGVPAGERQQYDQYARPLLAPLQSFSGSAGTSRDGRFGLVNLFVGIGNVS